MYIPAVFGEINFKLFDDRKSQENYLSEEDITLIKKYNVFVYHGIWFYFSTRKKISFSEFNQ